MKINLYFHAGSENHGCEALVRATCELFKNEHPIIKLYSRAKIQDEKYHIDEMTQEIIQYHRFFKEHTVGYYINNFLRFKFGYNNFFYRYSERELLKRIDKDGIYFSIGGDNYCYGNTYKNLGYINKKLSQKTKSVLWGASIEPDMMCNEKLIEDLKRYQLITVRESITYEALMSNGVCRNTYLVPDVAFILPTVFKELPLQFIEGKTIGINISPLAQSCGKNPSIVYSNFRNLVNYIIENTEYNVALIPHVVWKDNNDLIPLGKLYDEFKVTDRVCLINDCNCMELKGYIGRCEMFIGARTHATIAAYSLNVPTLTIGYSVKAKGIAKDLFGSYEKYVVPVQELKEENQIIEAFKWLEINQMRIREHLIRIMPDYCEKVFEAVNLVKNL